jgi:hypothetical protein
LSQIVLDGVTHLAGAVLAAAHGGFELDIGPQFLGLENVMLLGKCGEALEKRVDQLGGGCIEECLEGRLRDRVGSGEVTGVELGSHCERQGSSDSCQRKEVFIVGVIGRVDVLRGCSGSWDVGGYWWNGRRG